MIRLGRGGSSQWARSRSARLEPQTETFGNGIALHFIGATRNTKVTGELEQLVDFGVAHHPSGPVQLQRPVGDPVEALIVRKLDRRDLANFLA